MVTKITNGRFLLPEGIEEDMSIYLEDKKIVAVTKEMLSYDVELDVEGKYVSPGFIDIHVHGGAGAEFIDATKEAVLEACNLHFHHGTTTIFPTISSASEECMCDACEVIKKLMDEKEVLPEIAGIHLEGPYFSPKQSGGQSLSVIRKPDREEYMRFLEKYGSVIKRWSFAPELAGSMEFLECLNQYGIIAAAGHTDAEYEDMMRAYDRGLRLITHLYSCTSTVVRKEGFRKLGVIETAYLMDDIVAEAIADGCHLPPQLLQLIYKIKGADGMCLVTDCIRYGGMVDCSGIVDEHGEYPYVIEDGVAKLSDRSAFAGSIATSDDLIRTCVKKAGIGLDMAVRMITQTPARVMGLTTKGKLVAGYDADIVIFDDDIQIVKVIRNGTYQG